MGTVAPALKTIEDALEIRRRVLLAFEMAERQERRQRHSPPVSFVVVGGGPTGVELAGTLAEINRPCLAISVPSIPGTHIILVEGAPRVLPPTRKTSLAARKSNCGVWASKFVPLHGQAPSSPGGSDRQTNTSAGRQSRCGLRGWRIATWESNWERARIGPGECPCAGP